MKKIFTLSLLSLSALFFIVLGFSQTSCDKNTLCVVDVFVVDTTGHNGIQTPVAGAYVKLWENISAPGNTYYGTCDNSGHVQFHFAQPAIYDIQATSGTMAGTALVQLNIGGTVNQTVLIR